MQEVDLALEDIEDSPEAAGHVPTPKLLMNPPASPIFVRKNRHTLFAKPKRTVPNIGGDPRTLTSVFSPNEQSHFEVRDQQTMNSNPPSNDQDQQSQGPRGRHLRKVKVKLMRTSAEYIKKMGAPSN